MIRLNTLLLTVMLPFFLFAQTQTDANGKKQGYWKKKDPKTNKLVYEGLFKDDKPQGIFKYYYPHDSIKTIMNFKNNGAIAYSTMFHLNGKKMAYGKYIGENRDSVWTFYDDGALLISKESYKNGKKDGKVYVYFPDGVISEERSFKNDVMNGPYKLYFEKDLVKSVGVYVNGKMDGKNIFYYPNNVTAAVGYYKNGNKIGPWVYRDKKNNITEKELYKANGTLASKKETDDFFSKNKVASDSTKIPSVDSKVPIQKKAPAKKTATTK